MDNLFEVVHRREIAQRGVVATMKSKFFPSDIMVSSKGNQAVSVA